MRNARLDEAQTGIKIAGRNINNLKYADDTALMAESRVTIYSLDVLLSQLGTSLLFQVWFCCFLTCIQVSQEAGQVVWYSHLFKNFPQFVVIHTVKGFRVVR